MKKYKALMLDLDGTTIPNGKEAMPSQRVVDAVKKAHDKLAVCIATGRFLYEAAPVLDALQITNPVILLGGSQIIDGETREFIYKQPLEKGDILSVLEIIQPFHTLTRIREENKAIEYTPSYNPVNPFAIFLVNLSEETADEITDKLSHIPTITTHKIFSWTPGKFCLNIAHATATKQHAILEVAKKLGIETHEMIGVGDGYNDFPLLSACGFKVAMGNAVDDLKSIADYVAPTVEEDGVADVIEKFVLPV